MGALTVIDAGRLRKYDFQKVGGGSVVKGSVQIHDDTSIILCLHVGLQDLSRREVPGASKSMSHTCVLSLNPKP